MTEFSRLGSSSEGVSSSILLPGQATNGKTVEAYADDIPTLGRMVWTVGSTVDALSSEMVRTS
jgi:hypothetical protein